MKESVTKIEDALPELKSVNGRYPSLSKDGRRYELDGRGPSSYSGDEYFRRSDWNDIADYFKRKA